MPNKPLPLQARLFDLQLDRVDLVRAGSNTRADILLKKGKGQESMSKTYDGLLESLKPEEQEIIKAHVVEAEVAKSTEADAKIAALNEKITLLEKAAPAADPAKSTEEAILKGASPELLAHIQKMQTTVTELLDREADTIAKQRYESVKALPCEEAELKAILKSASPAVFELLQKAAKAVEEGVLKAKGSDAAGEFLNDDDGYKKLEKAAKTLSAEKSITFEKAFTEVCDTHPELYATYLKGAK